MSDLGVVVTDLNEPRGVTIIEVAGKLGVTNGKALAETLDAVLARGVLRVVLDLSKVPDIYSATAGLVLRYADELRSRGGGLVIASPHPNAALHLEMLGLKSRLRLCGDLTDALRVLDPNNEKDGSHAEVRDRA